MKTWSTSLLFAKMKPLSAESETLAESGHYSKTILFFLSIIFSLQYGIR
jgi:hypothetical protein